MILSVDTDSENLVTTNRTHCLLQLGPMSAPGLNALDVDPLAPAPYLNTNTKDCLVRRDGPTVCSVNSPQCSCCCCPMFRRATTGRRWRRQATNIGTNMRGNVIILLSPSTFPPTLFPRRTVVVMVPWGKKERGRKRLESRGRATVQWRANWSLPILMSGKSALKRS